jgi:hypothetical protein
MDDRGTLMAEARARGVRSKPSPCEKMWEAFTLKSEVAKQVSWRRRRRRRHHRRRRRGRRLGRFLHLQHQARCR